MLRFPPTPSFTLVATLHGNQVKVNFGNEYWWSWGKLASIQEPLLTCAKAVSNIAISLYKIKYWPQIIWSVVCLACYWEERFQKMWSGRFSKILPVLFSARVQRWSTDIAPPLILEQIVPCSKLAIAGKMRKYFILVSWCLNLVQTATSEK